MSDTSKCHDDTAAQCHPCVHQSGERELKQPGPFASAPRSNSSSSPTTTSPAYHHGPQPQQQAQQQQTGTNADMDEFLSVLFTEESEFYM